MFSPGIYLLLTCIYITCYNYDQKQKYHIEIYSYIVITHT